MPNKPSCKTCGANHWNYEPHSAAQNVGGTLDGVNVPPGYHIVRLTRPQASIMPVPPGMKTWNRKD